MQKYPGNNTSGKIIGSLLIGLSLILAFWTAYFPIRFSNDPWWHIKSGKVFVEQIREHGSLPDHDLFTLNGDQVPWIHHEWLSDMMIYGIYCAVGIPGLVIVKALGIAFLAGMIAWVLRRHRTSLGWCAAGALFAILMAQVSLYLRPHLLTYAFVVLWMDLMWRLKRSPRPMRIVAVACITEILWINLHGGAIIGIVLTAIALLEEIWWRLTGAPDDVQSDHELRRKATVYCFGGVTLASLMNPYGYQIHMLPGVVLRDEWLVGLIGELAPPDLKFVLGLRLILFTSILLLMFPIRRVSPFNVLTLLFFTMEATKHVRHIPLLAVTSAVVLFPVIEDALCWLKERITSTENLPNSIRPPLTKIFELRLDAIAAFLCIAYTMGWTLAGHAEGSIWRKNWSDRKIAWTRGYQPLSYPEGAVNYILYHKLAGPMFHDDNFAGYLIYRLSPETMHVYTDSRYDLFGSYYAKEQLAVRSASPEPPGLYAENGKWFSYSELYLDQIGDKKQRENLWRKHAMDLKSKETLDWLDSGKPYWQWVLDDKYNFNLILLYENSNHHYDRIQDVLESPNSGWKVEYRKNGYVLYQRDPGKKEDSSKPGQ